MTTKKNFALFLMAYPTIILATCSLSTEVDFNYLCKFKRNIALKSSENGYCITAFLQDNDDEICRIDISKISNTKGLLFNVDEGVNINLQLDNSGDLITLGKLKKKTEPLLKNNAITLVSPSNLTNNSIVAFPSIDFDLMIANDNVLRAESGGEIIINGPGFGSAGIVHNDNTGALSSSLIVDGDITVGTIASDKLADATLIALANYNTNGLLTQTAADTFTGRTIMGTANQIVVTNGDGIAGNPTVALADPLIFDDVTIGGNLTVDGTSTLTGNVGIGQSPASDALTVLGSIKVTESLLYTNDVGSGTPLIAAGSAQVNTRLEWANITGSNGSIISSSGTVASVRNSTGTYTLTITPGLKIDPAVIVTIKSASSLGSGVYTIADTVSTNATSTVITIRVYADDLLGPVNTDASFSILAVGIQ